MRYQCVDNSVMMRMTVKRCRDDAIWYGAVIVGAKKDGDVTMVM